jgi:uncharacterized membrane protein YdjX (TVP38/TMEM64 family)
LHAAVNALERRLQAVRALIDELGPLRWIALASAIVPTVGLFVVLAWLPWLAENLPSGWLGGVWAMVAITVAVAAMLLPAGMAAFAAGYCLGPWLGAGVALIALPLAGLVGQRLLWPLLGERLYAFMRSRPRIAAVRTLCASAAARGVLLLRGACLFPFQVISLQLSAAAIGAAAVVLGGAMAALPLASIAAGLGASLRRWRELGAGPEPVVGLSVLIGAGLAALLCSAGRRAWRRVYAA